MRALLAVCLGLLLPTARAGGAEGAPPPALVPTACHLPSSLTTTTGRRVTCATLTVPERHERPTGRQLSLRVTIFHAVHPTAEPVLFLSGGPGLAVHPEAMAQFTALRRAVGPERDLILLDQRGTGQSAPLLDCTETKSPTAILEYNRLRRLNPAQAERLSTRLTHVCRARLRRAGVDLTAYNTVQNARDVTLLVKALRVPRVNLYGFSYGTRLALDVMRLIPGSLRAVILDSPLPDTVDYHGADDVENFESVLHDLLRRCQADETCDAAFPDAPQRFLRVLSGYARKRLLVEILVDPTRQETAFPYRAGPRELLGALRTFMYDGESIAFLPFILRAMEQRDPEEVGNMLGHVLDNQLQGADVVFTTTSCQDVAGHRRPGQPREVYPGLHAVVRPDVDSSAEWCASWVGQASRNLSRLPVPAGIPTLILSKRYDPATGPLFVQKVQDRLPQAYVFQFDDVGHGLLASKLASRCAVGVARAFLLDPGREPGRSCWDEPFEFQPLPEDPEA